MNQRRWMLGMAFTLAFMMAKAEPANAQQGPNEPNSGPGTYQAHDFKNGYYRQNGLNPMSPDFRRRFNNDGISSVATQTTDPTRNKTRILPVNCG